MTHDHGDPALAAVREYWSGKEALEAATNPLDIAHARNRISSAAIDIIVMGVHHSFNGRIPTVDQMERWYGLIPPEGGKQHAVDNS